MDLGAQQTTHFLNKMQKTYAASITIKTATINKINSRSKRMLTFCLLMWKPKTFTISNRDE